MVTVDQQDSQELLADFVDEAIGSLHGLPEQLLAYQNDSSAAEPIHGVFRAIHSIKGCAGFLGLTAIKTFAHALENHLDQVRTGQVALGNDLRLRLVQSFDLLEIMLHEASGGGELQLNADAETLLAQVGELAAAARTTQPSDPWAAFAALAQAWEISSDPVQADCGRQLRETLAQVLPSAAESNPCAFDNDDRQSNAVTGESTNTESSPSVIALRPADLMQCKFYIGEWDATERVAGLVQFFAKWELDLPRPDQEEAFLKEAASLVEAAQQAGDAATAHALAEAANDFRTVHLSPLEFDSALLSLVWEQLVTVLNRCRQPEPSSVVADQHASNGASNSPPSRPAGPLLPTTAKEGGVRAASSGSASRQLRIREENLDEFLEHVSGLFITGELLKDLHSRLAERHQRDTLVDELRQLNRAFMRQSTSLQKSVIALRRVPAASLLGKFPRMARTLAADLGKQVDVQLAGEQTEIDKNLLEALDAPLTHMVRNVVDHAIELPEARQRAGKSAAGKLILKVEQQRSRVRITIEDDGRGIDPAALKRKAVERGIVSEEAAEALTDEAARELIFAPGFSTAQQVSEISGRGVGMDVVRTALESLGGRIIVHSTVGRGTRFDLEVPLRDAVLVVDGLLLRHQGQSFVVPFEYIREITSVGQQDLRPMQGTNVIQIRDQIYDAVQLDQALHLSCSSPEPLPGYGLVVGCREGQACLLIDHVIGHRQAVINSLQGTHCEVESIAGVAQLGGGRLALVLSVPDIVKRLNC